MAGWEGWADALAGKKGKDAKNHITACGLFGTDGSVWGLSPRGSLVADPPMIKSLIDAVGGNAAALQASGLILNKTKFMYLNSIEDKDKVVCVVTRSGSTGVIASATSKAVVIAYYGDGQLAQTVIDMVSGTVKDLRAAGFA